MLELKRAWLAPLQLLLVVSHGLGLSAPPHSPRVHAQVQQFVEKEDFARFTRIVFDMAPTGHTLRLLTSCEGGCMVAGPEVVGPGLACLAFGAGGSCWR